MKETNRSVIMVSGRDVRDCYGKRTLYIILEDSEVLPAWQDDVLREFNKEGRSLSMQSEGTIRIYRGVESLNPFKQPDVMEEEVTEKEMSFVMKNQEHG